jgi:hypothetical protein
LKTAKTAKPQASPEKAKKARGRPRKKPENTAQPTPTKRGRGRPSKVQTPTVAPNAKRRGRPRKTQQAPAQPVEVKRRGRPPKQPEAAVSLVCKPIAHKKAAVDTIQDKLEKHPLYSAAVWIHRTIPESEQAYLRKTANRHGHTVMMSILDHMLGYFSIHNTELNKILKEAKTQHTT